MENSILIAKILGPVLVAASLGMIINSKHYRKFIEDFANNASLLYIGGLLALVSGILMVNSHNVWHLKWYVIITVFGWLALVKGFLLVVFPPLFVKIMLKFKDTPTYVMIICGVIYLLLGAFFCYMGYPCFCCCSK